MPPTNLVAKILCQGHNNALSPVDEAGVAAMNVLREVERVHVERRQYLESGRPRFPFPEIRYEIDGRMFERWMLKTVINYEIAGDQNLPLGPPPDNLIRPPKEFVEFVFGNRSFQPFAGLYFLGRLGASLNLADRIRYTSWIAQDDRGCSYVAAGQILFYNLSFVLNLDSSRALPQRLETQQGTLNAIHRPRGFEMMLNNRPSQTVAFKW